ncbi:IS66-like element ISBthe6 family transposase [Bacteroidales bacterium]
MASAETVTLPKAEYDKMVNELAMLKHELAQLKRMIFGSKSERHIPADPNQPTLFELPIIETPEPEKEQISYTRDKSQSKKQPVRTELPAHLERVIEVIEPQNLPLDAHQVNVKITEVLEYEPGKLYVRVIQRPYYIGSQNDERTEFIIAPMPSRALPKSNAGESLLAHLILSKYVDHLPFYRQVQMFKRQGVDLAESTINGWFSESMALMEPLYQALKAQVIKTDYLMADETPIPVQTKDKPGATHKGYHWVYYNPQAKLVLFDYRKSRGREGPNEILKDFKGYLQTDGYKGYDELKNKPDITHLACMAHARRYFEKALDNDKHRSEYALALIRKLYAIEREAKEQQLDAGQVRELRQQKAVAILNEFERWLKDQIIAVLPASAIGKAMAYTLRLWPGLIRYTQDGRLSIDNNHIENTIRPVALGRKNYLFAGSHDGAERAAMIYSFLASCKINDINPQHWLKDALTRLPDYPTNRLHELLPAAEKP